jgi:hypothetical protein
VHSVEEAAAAVAARDKGWYAEQVERGAVDGGDGGEERGASDGVSSIEGLSAARVRHAGEEEEEESGGGGGAAKSGTRSGTDGRTASP